MTGVTAGADRGGRRVAVKRVDGVLRAREEAALLQSLRHPGTVEVLRLDEDDDGTGAVIVLGHVDGPRLDEVTLPPPQLAAVVAAVATTVADLHACGVVHGALRAEHVLLEGGRTPRLCGFGSAATRPPGAEASTEPGSDVYDLAVLLRDGVARWRSAHGDTGREDRNNADAVDAIARRVVLAPPGRRPTAGRLAAELGGVHGARLPGTPVDGARPQVPARPGPPAFLVACIAVSVVVSALAVARLWSPGQGQAAPAPVAATGPPSTRPPSTRPPSTRPPSTRGRESTDTTPVRGGTPCPVVSPGVAVDPDGDGCGEGASVEGRRIRTASGLFEVGDDGDELALGDWDCDGLATPAVLRRATGRVFVFGRWPGASPVTGAAVATVEGATGVRAVRRDAERCDRLLVDLATGASAMVDLGRPS